MADGRTFVVIGGGQAGGWTAKTLRDEGFEGRVVLIGDEVYQPYERPPLSKEMLSGEAEKESTYLWPDGTLEGQDIELRLGTRVSAIDRDSKSLSLNGGEAASGQDGETLAYDRLMIATGARVRKLDLPGGDLDGVHYLRAIPETEAIRADMQAGLQTGGRVLVIGGGWIGLEIASAARKMGLEVTVVEAADRLCGRALTPDLCDTMRELHEANGVDIRLSMGVDRLEGDGRLARAVLSDGTTLDVSVAVIGIGVIPNAELAAEAGLDVDNGIVVDELCRTSDPDIFSAGDVTNHPNKLLGRRIRLESWENAQNQGIAAAKSMLDKGEAYTEIPWFWSDQHGVNIQLVGLPMDWDETVTRGDRNSGQFVVFFLKDGKIDGAAGIDQGRDVRIAKRMMQAGKQVSAADLADESIKLQKLMKG